MEFLEDDFVGDDLVAVQADAEFLVGEGLDDQFVPLQVGFFDVLEKVREEVERVGQGFAYRDPGGSGEKGELLDSHVEEKVELLLRVVHDLLDRLQRLHEAAVL